MLRVKLLKNKYESESNGPEEHLQKGIGFSGGSIWVMEVEGR